MVKPHVDHHGEPGKQEWPALAEQSTCVGGRANCDDNLENGCENYNRVLTRLYREKKISMDVALKAAPNPEELRMAMSGITVSEGGIV